MNKYTYRHFQLSETSTILHMHLHLRKRYPDLYGTKLISPSLNSHAFPLLHYSLPLTLQLILGPTRHILSGCINLQRARSFKAVFWSFQRCGRRTHRFPLFPLNHLYENHLCNINTDFSHRKGWWFRCIGGEWGKIRECF